MDMCYDGALVLPSSYAVMDEEEMCYTEGGYVSRSVNWISYPIDIACTAIGLNASAIMGCAGAAIAKFAASLFNRKGKRTMYSGDFSARFRGMYDQNDCALFFTVSGETREVIDRIKDLKKYDIKIIVVTNNASSSAAKMSDLALTYYMPSTKNSDFYSSATQVPVLYIIESIANLFIEYGIY